MHFTVLIASVLAHGMTATAAPTSNTRWAQIRLYGEPGCFRQNMGELGIYDANVCRSLGDYEIRSVLFETDHVGCSCMFKGILLLGEFY